MDELQREQQIFGAALEAAAAVRKLPSALDALVALEYARLGLIYRLREHGSSEEKIQEALDWAAELLRSGADA